MIRREFLRRSFATAAGAGLALSGVSGAMATGRSLRPVGSDSFSIDVVTDRPTDVLNAISRHLADNRLSSGSVRVQMAQLGGSHVSEAVFVRNARLVDFRNADGATEEFLRRLSDRFAFRSSVSDPTLLRFSGGVDGGGGVAQNAQLFAGDLLVAQRTLNGEAFEEKLVSAQGSVVVRYDRDGVRIVDATCKHRTCVKAGTVTMAGESLVCIPARLRVVLTGAGARADGVDIVTQ